MLKKLLEIQLILKVPKNQYNDFGKFKYRSCEDILEAAKPILKEKNCVVYFTDSVENIGNRNYVKATAHFVDLETNETLTIPAYAREDETKKGMDGAQITGASSSYARKYALNALFAIDDTKDPDTNEYKNQQDKENPEEIAKKIQIINKLILEANNLKIDFKNAKTINYIKKYTNGKTSTNDMNLKELINFEKVLNSLIKRAKEIKAKSEEPTTNQ
jgi:hypothetical protein